MTRPKDQDRLRSLPDDILAIILSFLPTKSAVATAILSRSWRYLWTQITAIRLTFLSFTPQLSFAKLLHTLERIPLPNIQAIELNIRLNIDPPTIPITSHEPTPNIDETLHCLVNYIFRNCPTLTNIKLKLKQNSELYFVRVPPCVFEKHSLEVLELHNLVSSSNQGSNIKLPNLRRLVISLIHFNLKFFGILVTSCPSLEILWVHVEYDVRYPKFKDPIEITSRKLRWLTVSVAGRITIYTKIMVDVPKLEYLVVDSANIVEFFFATTPDGLVEAQVFMGDGNTSSVKTIKSLLDPMFRVRTLDLSGDVVLALSSLEDNVVAFQNLTHLEMDLSCSRSWKGVMRFLQCCLNLETLVLRRRHDVYDYSKWLKLDDVPCLHTKLRRMEMWCFRGSDVELKFIVRYITHTAKDLKILEIFCNHDEVNQLINRQNNNIVHPQIRILSKKLPNCHVKFTGLGSLW